MRAINASSECRQRAEDAEKRAGNEMMEVVFCLMIWVPAAMFACWLAGYEASPGGALIVAIVAAIALSGAIRAYRASRRYLEEADRLRWQADAEDP